MNLSVIIPTRNKIATAQLLATRIREILPALELEIVVVTPTAQSTLCLNDSVRYVSDEGVGVYRAYEAGLQSALGEYIWFMGDDDYPLDGAAGMSELLKKGAADVLIAPVLFTSGRIYRPTRSLLLLHFLNWCQQGVIYRKSTLRRRRFFHRLSIQADQYVNILLRSDLTVTKSYIAEPICMFGVHGISGHGRDEGYRSLRLALAYRTLSCGAFVAFRMLLLLEPLVKRLVKIR